MAKKAISFIKKIKGNTLRKKRDYSGEVVVDSESRKEKAGCRHGDCVTHRRVPRSALREKLKKEVPAYLEESKEYARERELRNCRYHCHHVHHCHCNKEHCHTQGRCHSPSGAVTNCHCCHIECHDC